MFPLEFGKIYKVIVWNTHTSGANRQRVEMRKTGRFVRETEDYLIFDGFKCKKKNILEIHEENA